MAYDVRDFERDVLQRSREVPVLVDFWAPWCGPCKVLGPVLEKLAAESQGRWELIKINTEEDQELAMTFDIRSIPAVKLFHNGEVVDEFTGALPEAQIRRWLAKALPSAMSAKIDEARRNLEGGDRIQAAQLSEEILSSEPDNAEARMLLGEALLFQAPERVTGVLAPITEGSDFADRAEAVRTLAGILANGTEPQRWPESPVREKFIAALRALKVGDFGAALPAFIEVVERGKGYADGTAKAACRAIFQLLGVRHPVIEKHYRALASALHS